MKKLLLILSMIMILSLFGCGNKVESNSQTDTEAATPKQTEKQTEMTELPFPEDFEFSLTWNCNGDSTYDSASGKLVKQKVATHIEDYTTTYKLTDEQKKEIYELIVEMNPSSYPDNYNPIEGMSAPSRTIIFSVTYNGFTKTITCLDVSLADIPNGKMGKKFMNLHDTIVKILISSEEWKALPEVEFYYD